MASGAAAARLIFVLLLVINAILFSIRGGPSVHRTVLGSRIFGSGEHGLRKRDVGVLPLGIDVSLADKCAPLTVPIAEQCAYVRESCEDSDTVLAIPYLQSYFCAVPATRPFIFAGLAVWLLFLFSTLGISASDFFCPNLASIATLMGLDDNVAGVTLLALGNGSPDVFSTFSAMRTDAGSLAIGELLGAASFITSVVVGSMCLVRPFHVHRAPFFRDVGFFTIAVSVVLFILWDGHIHAWEAGLLLGLYALYATLVVVGSWWENRQLKRMAWEVTVRGEYADEEVPRPPTIVIEEPYHDEPIPVPDEERNLTFPLASPRTRTQSSPAAPGGASLSVPPSRRLQLDTNIAPHTHAPPNSSLPRMRSPSTATSRYTPLLTPHPAAATRMPSFSLIGALEFRQVVSSLQAQAAAGNALGTFDVRTPLTPFPGGHYGSPYNRARFSSSASHPSLAQLRPVQQLRRAQSQAQGNRYSLYEVQQTQPLRNRSFSPFAAWFRRRDTEENIPVRRASLPLDERLSSPGDTLVDTSVPQPAQQVASGDAHAQSVQGQLQVHVQPPRPPLVIPRITHIPPSPVDGEGSEPASASTSASSASETDVDSITGGTPYLTIPPHRLGHPGDSDDALSDASSQSRGPAHALKHTAHVLFPTLHNFRMKSFPAIVASILAAPAVLGLTLTLPVHVQPREGGWGDDKLDAGGVPPDACLVEFEEEGVERVLTAEEDVRVELAGQDLAFNRYLCATQLVFGPLFCVAVVFSGADWYNWILLGTGIAGIVCGALVLMFAERGDAPWAVGGRCAMGFVVAVVWIMAIADEVVNLLKTFGFIFGLSDAIIGLTIFAVGQSLADLVANVSVVAFAPIMGFSACFGGPMFNILLGIGGSGTYIIHAAGGEPYVLHFSTTLMVSAIGLLTLLFTTLLFVPLNGYYLPRKWGVFLIFSYLCIMATNVFVEVRRHSHAY